MNRPLTRLQIWTLAARPRTLPAAAAPVLIGLALAAYMGRFRPLPALVTLLGGLLLQIGANFANDLFDHLKGADTAERVGPLRVTQAGLLTPREMRTGLAVVFGMAAGCGLYLAAVSGWPVVAIGAVAILAALAYTGGPYPLGYHGLGEVFVFLFFGLAAVMGTCFIQTGQFTWASFAAALPPGFLSVAILVVNNLRDLPTDRAAGKRTLAVRYGAEWTRREYLSVLSLAYLVPFLTGLSGVLPYGVILVWGSLPLVPGLTRSVWNEQGRTLNRTLAGTGSLELLYALLFAGGLAFSRALGI